MINLIENINNLTKSLKTKHPVIVCFTQLKTYNLTHKTAAQLSYI